jgi:hypothetical protein
MNKPQAPNSQALSAILKPRTTETFPKVPSKQIYETVLLLFSLFGLRLLLILNKEKHRMSKARNDILMEKLCHEMDLVMVIGVLLTK